MAIPASQKPQFYVVELGAAEADSAYPLVRSVAPEIACNEWRDYVRRRCRTGGFKGLFDNNDILTGLFSYRLGERLRQGRVLALDDFVTFELSVAAPARKALLAAAEDLARDQGCAGLELRIGSRGLAEEHSRKAQGWTSLGMALDSVVFVKPL